MPTKSVTREPQPSKVLVTRFPPGPLRLRARSRAPWGVSALAPPPRTTPTPHREEAAGEAALGTGDRPEDEAPDAQSRREATETPPCFPWKAGQTGRCCPQGETESAGRRSVLTGAAADGVRSLSSSGKHGAGGAQR